MAMFKIVNRSIDESGNEINYKEESDLYNLIYYVCRKGKAIEVQNIFPLGRFRMANQMLYAQHCSGKKLKTRALHFVLSFDTEGWEWEMRGRTFYASSAAIWGAAKKFDLKDYQCIMAFHNKPRNRHIHIIVNPVNLRTNQILHYNMFQYKSFLKELALELHMRYGLALAGTSYIDERGRLRFSDEYEIMYQDRMYPWDPHMSEIYGKREDCLNPFKPVRIKR